MSRSNPHDNGATNPAVRWFEWNGENGVVRYYDKDAKKNVDVDGPFSFILLDELASVRGWHEASQSGIYSNEVRDVSQDVMVVKSFKGGIQAEGVYRDIKDRVNALGGHYTANCYIAFKHNGALAIGSIRFKGAALGSWMEFRKAHRAELFKKAVAITGTTKGKKGRIVYQMPVFTLRDLSDDSNRVALALDMELQAFLASYLKRPKREQAEQPTTVPPAPEDEFASDAVPPPMAEPPVGITDDDIPF